MTHKRLDERSKSWTRLKKCLPSAESRKVADDLAWGEHELQLQHERQLRDLEGRCERHVRLYDEAPVALVTLDLDGRIADVNRAAASFFGLERNALVGAPMTAFMSSSDAERFRSLRDDVAHTREPRSVALPLRSKGNHFACVDCVVRSGASSGHHETEHHCVFVPRSRERPAEAPAPGSLAAGVAHDMNSVLQVVVGAIGLALDVTTPPAQAHASLLRARSVSVRAAALVARLTKIGRVEHGQPASVLIDGAILALHAVLLPLVGEHIQLVLDLRAPRELVHACRADLERILLHLVSNARDAMPKGGMLVVRTIPRIGGGVRLSVEDTGHGIDVDTGRRALLDVRALVERRGGTMSVASEPGDGTTVAIELPSTDVTPRTRREPAPRFHGSAIVVDDEPVVRHAIGRQLEALGFHVVEASDPRRVLHAAEPPDLLVCDVLMPVMVGSDLVAELRKRWPSLRVLYVSGHPGDAIDVAALAQGTGFLAKPFADADLVASLVALLGAAAAPASVRVPALHASRHVTVLLVAGDEASRRAAQALLVASGVRVLGAATGAEARTLARSWAIDVLVTDVDLSDGRGALLVEDIERFQPDIAVGIVGDGSFATDLPSARLGRPLDVEKLLALVDARAPLRD